MMSSTQSDIAPGMRFMPALLTIGTQTVGAWEVVEIFPGMDGIQYARLANRGDTSRKKTVACDALMNRRLYARVS